MRPPTLFEAMVRRFMLGQVGALALLVAFVLAPLGCSAEPVSGEAGGSGVGVGSGSGSGAGGGASGIGGEVASLAGGTTGSGGVGAGGIGGSAGVGNVGGMAGETSFVCNTERIRLIFQTSCAAGVCHDASKPAAELDLSGADPAGQLVEVASPLCTGQLRVVPGSPEQSFLWQKLTQTEPTCGDKMPIAVELLPADLACIEEWIVNLGSGVVDCETCGGTACVDTATDALHCGACDNACAPGQVCSAGACAGCVEGEMACGATCVNVQSDPDNCGACGAACGAGESCLDGECRCLAGREVAYAEEVAPLLDAACTGNGCHVGRMPKEGLDLSETTSYSQLVSVASSQCSDGRLLVDPGNPAESYLLNKLTGVDLCGGTLMPKADGALDEASVATIAAWICNGAPDN